ncbi:hypothetical protein IWW48_003674 [Coemansia sp. RSA 1200]|nr:hypothetical protein IWW48_003674 [Coemansia sp. RSA 1200]
MVKGKIDEIHGWAAMKPGIDVERWSYKPRPIGEHDVEIKIDFTGICGSDLHTIKDEWNGTSYPVIVGHEIVGKVVTKGDRVTEFNEGDIVGVGAQCYADLKKDCHACSNNLDPHCPNMVSTYNSKYADGAQAQGGYSEAIRVDANYAFKIPSSIDPAHAAPLMCAGTTVFAPMLRNGVKKGDRVGVVGIGGLGHLAIQYAKALGAEVVAFSHSPNKRDECLKLGASKFVDTSNKKDIDAIRHSLTYLFITSSSKHNNYEEFITWMDFEGQVVLLAIPEGKLSFSPFDLILSEVAITGSMIGGVNIVKEALEFAAKHNIRPIIERYPLDDVNAALKHVDEGKARYRVVLTH